MRLLFLVMILLTVCLACKRDKVEPKGPVEVEYRVSSSSGATVAYIDYTNETGGTTNMAEAPLPFSVKFKSTQRPTPLTVLVILPDQNGQQQSVTGTILVNGKEVKSETGVGSSAAVNVIYVLQ